MRKSANLLLVVIMMVALAGGVLKSMNQSDDVRPEIVTNEPATKPLSTETIRGNFPEKGEDNLEDSKRVNVISASGKIEKDNSDDEPHALKIGGWEEYLAQFYKGGELLNNGILTLPEHEGDPTGIDLVNGSSFLMVDGDVSRDDWLTLTEIVDEMKIREYTQKKGKVGKDRIPVLFSTISRTATGARYFGQTAMVFADVDAANYDFSLIDNVFSLGFGRLYKTGTLLENIEYSEIAWIMDDQDGNPRVCSMIIDQGRGEIVMLIEGDYDGCVLRTLIEESEEYDINRLIEALEEGETGVNMHAFGKSALSVLTFKFEGMQKTFTIDHEAAANELPPRP